MTILKFQVRLHTGQIEQLSIEGDGVLIGSAAHCEIRLPVDQARPEHVMIQVVPQGVYVRAVSFEPPPTLNEMPFSQAELQSGSTLGVGQCQIFVEFANPAAGEKGGAQKKKGLSPLTLVALLVILPAGYVVLTTDPAPDRPAPPPREVPGLWAAPIETCPYTGLQALALAREKIAVADAKRERRPFRVQDGVQAVPLYELASACFRTGGDGPSAALATDSAKFLRHDIVEDFRLRRVRLEHDLAIQDYLAAQREVRTLLQFVDGRSGEYVTWLVDLERKLKRAVAAPAKSAKPK